MSGQQEIVDLYDLMLEQLRDLYDGEKQQMQAFWEFDDQVFVTELQEIIAMHMKETRRHIERLKSVFYLLNEDPEGESCDGIWGIIQEAHKLLKRCKNAAICDAALITAIQHINHYEIAGYGTAISYAKTLERHEIAELLLDTLREERSADWGLSDLAEGQVNPDAKWTSLIKKINNRDQPTTDIY